MGEVDQSGMLEETADVPVSSGEEIEILKQRLAREQRRSRFFQAQSRFYEARGRFFEAGVSVSESRARLRELVRPER